MNPNEEQSEISYSFSDISGVPIEDIIDLINNSDSSLNIAIYNLDNTDIVDAVLSAKQRGVEIKIIIDKEKAENNDTEKILTKFYKENIPVKINTEKKMHMKLAISDSKIIAVGSLNYTSDSAEENQENLITIQNTKLANEFVEIFEKMWESDSYSLWKPKK